MAKKTSKNDLGSDKNQLKQISSTIQQLSDTINGMKESASQRTADITPNQIRDRLVHTIESKGLSIAQACEETGVNKNVVFNMKTYYPNVSTLINFARFLGTDMNQLCGFDDVTEDSITKSEKELIGIYRQLSKADQQKAIGILTALV